MTFVRPCICTHEKQILSLLAILFIPLEIVYGLFLNFLQISFFFTNRDSHGATHPHILFRKPICSLWSMPCMRQLFKTVSLNLFSLCCFSNFLIDVPVLYIFHIDRLMSFSVHTGRYTCLFWFHKCLSDYLHSY